MVKYLTGVSNQGVRDVAHEKQIGLLITPDTGYHKQIGQYPFWAADNACFNHPERFVTENYLAWLAGIDQSHRASCLFATAPDVVGDAKATLERSAPVLQQIRALGYLAALVAQDGLELLDIPWDTFDVFFIGGSTEWKLGEACEQLCIEAKRRGKTIHMGRVNSYKRFKIADGFGCDTADGTFLAFGPTANLVRLVGWIDKLELALHPVTATA